MRHQRSAKTSRERERAEIHEPTSRERKRAVLRWTISAIEQFEPRRLLSTTWYVDAAAPGSTHDGKSWQSAYTDLQQALASTLNGDSIRVAQGTYKPTSTTDQTISFRLTQAVSISGGWAGNSSPDPDVQNWSDYPTILSGDIGKPGDSSDNSYHVIVGSDTWSASVMEGLTITGGNARGIGVPGSVGGGILNLAGGGPTVEHCIFTGNSALYKGGAVYDDSNSLYFGYCTFVGNTSLSQGGGIYNASASPSLDHCTFTRNSASDDGGAIYNDLSSSATLTYCDFDGNSAGAGGAVDNFSSSPTFTNCTFVRNSAIDYGGGIENYDASPSITACMFDGNSAGKSGGGINNDGRSSPTIINCAFSGNFAIASGGGLSNLNSATPTLTNCTFSGNSAPQFAAISNGGSSISTLANALIWGNSNEQLNRSFATYTDIEGGLTGTGNIDADPIFYRNPSSGADGTWGTADDDYGDLRLWPGSPCIDAGSNSAVPSNVYVDLGGNRRMSDFPGVNDPGAIVDMGAYEASTDLGALHLIGGQHPVLPAGKRVFLVGQLVLDPGATLDLTDNDLVSRIRGSLGSWTGSTYDGFMGMIESGALFSSLAKNRYTMLGAATAREIFGISGYATRSFDGQSVFADDVLIKFTYDGDANLDGKVNIDDYGRIDANVGQSGIVFGWYNGDFNFDGKINIDDYGLIDSVIGSQGPVL